MRDSVIGFLPIAGFLQALTISMAQSTVPGVGAKARSISIPPELGASIERRVRSGLYGNASDVIRAGLRALAREELGASLKRFEEITANLPSDPITPAVEQDVETRIRAARQADKPRARK